MASGGRRLSWGTSSKALSTAASTWDGAGGVQWPATAGGAGIMSIGTHQMLSRQPSAAAGSAGPAVAAVQPAGPAAGEAGSGTWPPLGNPAVQVAAPGAGATAVTTVAEGEVGVAAGPDSRAGDVRWSPAPAFAAVAASAPVGSPVLTSSQADAVAKATLRAVLEAVLGESGPQLDHYVLSAQAVAAVASQRAAAAATKQQQQAQEASDKKMRTQEAKAVREAEEKLSKATAAMNSRVELLQRELAAAEREKTQLQGRLTQHGRAAKESAAALATCQEQLAAATKQLDKHTKANAKVEAALSRAREEHAVQVRQLEETLGRCRQEAEQAACEARKALELERSTRDSAAREGLLTKQAQHAQHTQHAQQLATAASAARQQLQQAAVDVSGTQGKLRAELDAVPELLNQQARQQRDEADALVAQLRADVAAAGVEMRELTALARERAAAAGEAAAQLAQLAHLGPGGVTRLLQELAQARESAASHERQAQQQQHRAKALEVDKLQLLAERNTLLQQLRDASTAQQEVQQRADELANRLKQQQEAAAGLNKQLAVASRELGALKEVNASLEAVAQLRSAELHVQQQAVADLERRLAAGKAEAEATVQKLAAAAAEQAMAGVRQLTDRYFDSDLATAMRGALQVEPSSTSSCSSVTSRDAANAKVAAAAGSRLPKLRPRRLQDEEFVAAVDDFSARRERFATMLEALQLETQQNSVPQSPAGSAELTSYLPQSLGIDQITRGAGPPAGPSSAATQCPQERMDVLLRPLLHALVPELLQLEGGLLGVLMQWNASRRQRNGLKARLPAKLQPTKSLQQSRSPAPAGSLATARRWSHGDVQVQEDTASGGLTAQLVRAMAEEKRLMAQQIKRFEARKPIPGVPFSSSSGGAGGGGAGGGGSSTISRTASNMQSIASVGSSSSVGDRLFGAATVVGAASPVSWDAPGSLPQLGRGGRPASSVDVRRSLSDAAGNQASTKGSGPLLRSAVAQPAAVDASSDELSSVLAMLNGAELRKSQAGQLVQHQQPATGRASADGAAQGIRSLFVTRT